MDEQTRKSYWVYETTVQLNDRLVMSKKFVRSKAFIKLTGAAKQILLELYMRLTLDNYKPQRNNQRSSQQFFAKNNGKLKLTYKDIYKQFGYSTRTISKAIDQLVNCGFIEIVELGCGVKRLSHKIALINSWQDYGDKENFKTGSGKANEPVNGGFKKRKQRQDLETTLQSKAGTTLQSKDVQCQKATQIAG